jgi:hypothetical protein
MAAALMLMTMVGKNSDEHCVVRWSLDGRDSHKIASVDMKLDQLVD